MPFGFGKKSSSNKQSKEELKSSLRQKPPKSWNEHEVSVWVELVGLSDYASLFVDQAVTGSELLQLNDSGLDSLGITKFGPRKKLKSNLETLAGNAYSTTNSAGNPPSTSTNSSFTLQQSQSQSSNSQTNPSLDSSSSTDEITGEVRIKFVFEGEIVKVAFHRDVSIDELQQHAASEFEPNLLMKYRDEEDDLVTIRKNSDLSNLFSQSKKTVKIYLFRSENNNLNNNNNQNNNNNVVKNQNQDSTLEQMLDAVVVTDCNGIVQFLNHAAQQLFGRSKIEVMGHNVSMLIPEPHSKRHNQYIQEYLRTGFSHAIGGGGRIVTALHKNGTVFQVWISIAENKNQDNRRFIATIQHAASSPSSSSSSPQQLQQQSSLNNSNSINNNNNNINNISNFISNSKFKVLENLSDSTVVSDTKGRIIFFNQAAQNMFGYTSSEVMGQNVKMLMPPSVAREHDYYIDRYSQTRQPRVINQTRDVIAQKKDGTLIPISISLSEDQNNDQPQQERTFMAVMRMRKNQEEESPQEKSILQQEREVMSNLAVPAMIVDENGIVQGFNKGGMELLGYNLMDILGKHVKVMLTEETLRHQEELARKTGEPLSNQNMNMITKNGKHILVNASASYRNAEGGKKIYTSVMKKID